MKNIIMGVATLFLYITVLISSFDTKMLLEMSKELNFITQETAATGSLFIDYEELSNGYMVFDDKTAMKAIDGQIKEYMNLDDNRKPIVDKENPENNSYWIGNKENKVEYEVHFYDEDESKREISNDENKKDKGTLKKYKIKNGEISEEEHEQFTWGDEVKIEKSNGDKAVERDIEYPTVVVKINAGSPRMRLQSMRNYMSKSEVTRTSIFTWQGY